MVWLRGWPATIRRFPRPTIVFSSLAIILAIVLGAQALGQDALARLPGHTANVANAPTIDGIPCDTAQQYGYHVHTQLTIFVDDQPFQIPAGVGIGQPWATVQSDQVQYGSCYYWLHTHDTSGLIHVEAPAPRPFTLGQFFDIWGEPLRRDNVAGQKGTVAIQVDGKLFYGDPLRIVLNEDETIVIQVHSP